MGYKMTKMDVGARSEALCVAALCEVGCEIGVPVHHSQAYDIIFRQRNRKDFKTIQVKTAYHRKSVKNPDTLEVSVTTRHRKDNYKKSDFDYLFVANCKNFWFMPFSKVKAKTNFVVTSNKYDKYKNKISFGIK